MNKTQVTLITLAIIGFTYALLGNYVALPGYIRFLDRGGTSTSGNTFDMEVLLGATRTVLWMYSFTLGAMCLYLYKLVTEQPSYLRYGIVICVVWILFWSVPSLPKMPPAFYILAGSLILVFIVGYHLGQPEPSNDRSRFLFFTSILFFALATWDVCGLGSTGRILHPAEVVLDRSQMLLNAQTTKLMIALLVAWFCLSMSKRVS